ncbi:MAG: hypothetical protein AAGH79_08290 [Bacteroidota bacterium]
MSTWTRILGLCAGLLFLVQGVQGQASFSATLDSTRFLIGDQLNLTFRAKHPKGYLVGEPDLAPLASGEGPIEILDAQMGWDTIQGQGTMILEKTLRITAWDTGYYQIPIIKAPFRLRANVDTLYTNVIPFEVKGIQVDTTQIAPIKPIVREEILWQDYLPYVYQILALIGVILLVNYFMRRARKVQNIDVPNLDLRRPAYLIAQERLEELKRKPWLEEGSIKKYYTELVEILRRYLEQGYYLPTREATTTGILRAIENRLGSAWAFMDELRAILQEGDLVKFANASPAIPETQETTRRLERMIDATRATGITQSDTYYRLVGNDAVLQGAVEAGLEIKTTEEQLNELYPTFHALPEYSEAVKPVSLNNWQIPLFGAVQHQRVRIWLPAEIRSWQQRSISWSIQVYDAMASALANIPGIGGLLFYLILILLSPLLLVLSIVELLLGKLPFGKGNLVLRDDGVLYFKVKVEETSYAFMKPTAAQTEEE